MLEYLSSYSKLELPKIINHILRYSVSELGRSHINSITPSNSLQEIKYNLDLTTEMKQLLETDDPLPIHGLIDITTQLNKAGIEDYIIQGLELHHISNFLKVSRNISSYFNRRKSNYILLNELVKLLYVDKIIEFNIDRAINDDGNVRDGASAELKNIRREINSKSELLRKKLDSILKTVSAQGWAQEEIITTRDNRMVIPVKIENKNRVPGFIHSSSASGVTVFIEPAETLEMNNDIRSLHFQETREIEKILKELTSQIRKVKQELTVNIEILGVLDFLQAKANYSIEILGSAPKNFVKGSIKLIDGRHPILLMRHKREEVVPLSLEIGNEYTTMIITGPNAGGKSVAIKTFGLLAQMIQSGLHIPASPESEFGVYKKIFVDIGDEQSIENDLSTFSSHLANLKVIVEEADEDSLVLIDEIGAGTDPTEGSALAEAILEYLTKTKAHTLVTTHHGTLKAFAHETAGIENASMEFDHNTLQPTYRFRAGIPGSSYALEMAKRMGIPDELINRSNEFKGETQHTLENLLAELENQSQISKKELETVKSERIQLEKLISEYTIKNKSFQKEIKEIKLKALEEAKSIIEKANSTIEKTVQQLRNEGGSKSTIKDAQAIIAKVKEEQKLLFEDLKDVENYESTPAISVGDFVKLKGGTETGQIIENLGSGHFNVLFGQIKLKASKQNLIKVDKREKSYAAHGSVLTTQIDKVSREIDLRGMLGEEAIIAIDKFIDEAILRGLHRVDLIHGKGTGALKKHVSEYLKKHPAVRSFRLGEWNEGGYGVTVVELK